MNLIVAVDENWGIGKDGDLLAHIKEDMHYFADTTRGGVVIMGRKTLESFPGGRPLKDRVNIVITNKLDYLAEDVIVVHSTKEAKEAAAQYTDRKVFVIGGGSIYEQMLSDCEKAYVTKIHKTFDADTYFPNLDEKEEWKMTWRSEEKQYSKGSFVFTIYEQNRA